MRVSVGDLLGSSDVGPAAEMLRQSVALFVTRGTTRVLSALIVKNRRALISAYSTDFGHGGCVRAGMEVTALLVGGLKESCSARKAIRSRIASELSA